MTKTLKYQIILVITLISCQSNNIKQMELTNEKVIEYSFLKDMYEDQYFPNNLVDKGKDILIDLCNKIETEKPKLLKNYIL